MSKPTLSRRDFLKLTGYGLMGIFLPELSSYSPPRDEFTNLQGRIIDRTVWAYDEPNLKAKRTKLYWHDLVVPITNITVGDDETAYNRVWYQLENAAYAYSGGIQPVRTLLTQPQQEIPTGAHWERSVFHIPMLILKRTRAQTLSIGCITKQSIGLQSQSTEPMGAYGTAC
jgi:hypothetical protein